MFLGLLHAPVSLTMVPDGEKLGQCINEEIKTIREKIGNSAAYFLESETAIRLEVEKEVMIHLAGKVSEHIVRRKPSMPTGYNIGGAINDFYEVEKSLRQITSGEDEWYYFQKWLWYRTWNYLIRLWVWKDVEALADELLVQRELTAQQVKEVLVKAAEKSPKTYYFKTL